MCIKLIKLSLGISNLGGIQLLGASQVSLLALALCCESGVVGTCGTLLVAISFAFGISLAGGGDCGIAMGGEVGQTCRQSLTLVADGQGFGLMCKSHDALLFLLEIAVWTQVVKHWRHKPWVGVATVELSGIGGKETDGVIALTY